MMRIPIITPMTMKGQQWKHSTVGLRACIRPTHSERSVVVVNTLIFDLTNF